MRAYATKRGDVLIPHSFITPEGAVAETFRLVSKDSSEAHAWAGQTSEAPPVFEKLADKLREAA